MAPRKEKRSKKEKLALKKILERGMYQEQIERGVYSEGTKMAPLKGKKAKREKLAPGKEKLAPEMEKLAPEMEKLELRTDQEQFERPVNNEAVSEKAFEDTKMAPQKGKKAKKAKKEKLELRTDQEQIERPVNNEAVWKKAFKSTIKRWNKLQPIKEVIENGGKKVVNVAVKGSGFCSRCQTQYPNLTMHVDMVYGYNTRSGKGEIRVVKENKSWSSWCYKCKNEARDKTSKQIIDEDSAKRAADYVFHRVKENIYDQKRPKDQKALSDPILWEFYYGKIN